MNGFLTFLVAATPAMATVKSVFTSSGAAGILTNDLVRIMENERVSQVFRNHSGVSLLFNCSSLPGRSIINYMLTLSLDIKRASLEWYLDAM